MNRRKFRLGKLFCIGGGPATMRSMTQLLEHAIESVRGLPAEAQDAPARPMLEFTDADGAPIPMSAEERSSFEESLAQAARGEFASEVCMRSIWTKHGL